MVRRRSGNLLRLVSAWLPLHTALQVADLPACENKYYIVKLMAHPHLADKFFQLYQKSQQPLSPPNFHLLVHVCTD